MKKLKVKQLVSGETTLTALAEDGSCWVYLGNKYGWRPMNMKAMSIRESIKACQEKFGGDE